MRGREHLKVAAVFAAFTKPRMLAMLSWHDLRHTWASWAVQSGVGATIMLLAGLARLAILLNYAHFAPDHLALTAA